MLDLNTLTERQRLLVYVALSHLNSNADDVNEFFADEEDPDRIIVNGDDFDLIETEEVNDILPLFMPTPKFSAEQLQAAADEIGQKISLNRIREAEDRIGPVPLPAMRIRLKTLEKQFESQGGRGVELADEIDDLRILIAIN